MQAIFLRRRYLASKPYTIAVTGIGDSSNCYLTLPDGTKTYSAGEYEFEKDSVIKCCVKGSILKFGCIVVNGETIYHERGSTLFEYEHVVTKNATVNLSVGETSGSENRITITEG